MRIAAMRIGLRVRAGVVSCLLLVAAAAPAPGIIIDTENDGVTTEAPQDDPGWDHVALRGSWSSVYLGGGWILTARHVGSGDVVLGGKTYTEVVGSARVLSNPNRTATDLVLFRVEPEPPFDPLPIRESPPPTGGSVLMVGAGHNRGGTVAWHGFSGFRWGDDQRLRWGTNTVAQLSDGLAVRNTHTFTTRFSIAASRFEAQAAVGDSGGPVFLFDRGRWELAGIMLAVDSYRDQPPNTALYGNQTFHADLSRYRDAIRAIIEGTPPPLDEPASASLR